MFETSIAILLCIVLYIVYEAGTERGRRDVQGRLANSAADVAIGRKARRAEKRRVNWI